MRGLRDKTWRAGVPAIWSAPINNGGFLACPRRLGMPAAHDAKGTKENCMDLGIAGRKAIVCASSRGLGFGCAKALAEAGCEVVINGRNEKKLAEAAAA